MYKRNCSRSSASSKNVPSSQVLAPDTQQDTYIEDSQIQSPALVYPQELGWSSPRLMSYSRTPLNNITQTATSGLLSLRCNQPTQRTVPESPVRMQSNIATAARQQFQFCDSSDEETQLNNQPDDTINVLTEEQVAYLYPDIHGLWSL